MFRPLSALVCWLALVATAQAGKGFTGKRVVSGYVPGYAVTPQQVPYKQFTHLDYFVFTTTWSAYSISTAGIEPATIQEFVDRAHANGVTISYTLGGWTGSKYFSTHVSTAYKRLLFAKTLVGRLAPRRNAKASAAEIHSSKLQQP